MVKHKTDEWKLVWIVEGVVKETLYETNPRPLAFIRQRKFMLERTTHRAGTLKPMHKDESVIALINQLNKQTKLKLH